MKNKNNRKRCTKCGTYLFNDISVLLEACAEHRPVLSPEKLAEFRKFARDYKKSVEEQVKAVKEEACDCGHSH